jgi:hypothetical protein
MSERLAGAPPALERFAAICLNADANDTRLGDLAERYVRTNERARACLGAGPLAATASRLAADLRYLISTLNVAVFARVVDPARRMAEPGTMATAILELEERAMAMLHATTRMLVVPALLLVASAFLIGSAVNVWSTWRETEALLVELQREKAETLARQIDQHLAAVQERIAWTTTGGSAVSPEQRRLDYLRLLRQVPAIVEVARIDGDGKEVLRVSRLARDTVGSGVDLSRDARFIEAVKRNKYFGPIHFDKRSEPHISVALANGGPTPGVTLAEVNAKGLWEIVDAAKVGETGYAYVVDDQGRLIAGRDRAMAMRQPDLTNLPQVNAASRANSMFDTSLSGSAVLSAHASVPIAGWTVYVELPAAEARAPLWNALVRAAWLLGLGVLAILLAGFAFPRPGTAVRPAHASLD